MQRNATLSLLSRCVPSLRSVPNDHHREARGFTAFGLLVGALTTSACLDAGPAQGAHDADPTGAHTEVVPEVATTSNGQDTTPGAGEIGATRTVGTDAGPGEFDCLHGCDDGNPCTDDACVAYYCVWEPLAACAPECSARGIVPLSETTGAEFAGVRVTTSGTVEMTSHPTCSDDGLCNCLGAPALVDGASEVTLRSTAPDETTMACRSEDGGANAMPKVSCEPFAAGVAHRVWGLGVGGTSPSFDVEGYCLETRGTALVGSYRLTFERDGRSFESAATITVRPTAEAGDTLVLEMSGRLCAHCMEYHEWSTLEVLDNGIRFALAATLAEGSVRIVARLVSSGDALVGDWATWLTATGPKFTLQREPDWGHDNSLFDVMPLDGPDHGTMRLERLPVATPRLVCPPAQ